MKNLNDVQIIGTIGATPKALPSKVAGTTDEVLALRFPVFWTVNGETHVVVAKAIDYTAENIRDFVFPGLPVIVTGELEAKNREEGIRLRVKGVERLLTEKRAQSVTLADGETIYTLPDGECRFLVRGHIVDDSVTEGDRHRTIVAFRDGAGVQHRLPLLAPGPLMRGQLISIEGHLQQPITQLQPIIVAQRVYVVESLVPRGESRRIYRSRR